MTIPLYFDLTEQQQYDLTMRLADAIVKTINDFAKNSLKDKRLPVSVATSALAVAMSFGINSLETTEQKHEEVSQMIIFLREITGTGVQ